MGNRKVSKLWRRRFDVVNEGLDESQVVEFVDGLILERDTLQEQVNSLLAYIGLSKRLVEGEGDIEGSSGEGVEVEVTDAENSLTNIAAEVWQDIQPEVESTESGQVMESLLPKVAGAAAEGTGDSSLYQGELELAILPPLDATGLLQFEKRLQNSFQMRIIRTSGSPSEGSLITIWLNEPQSVLQGLRQMPGVKKAVEKLDASTIAGGTSALLNNKHGERIWVILSKGS